MGDITTAQSPASPPTSALPPVRQRLLEVIALFLKLGTISFGGPAAHIALMEQETVHKRRWLSREHFLDLLAATNLVPGPNATEMAVHIGFLRAGWPGLFAAGLAFILPAFLISLGLAVVYVRYQALPQGDAVMYGISPGVAAVVITATYRLALGGAGCRYPRRGRATPGERGAAARRCRARRQRYLRPAAAALAGLPGAEPGALLRR